MRRKLSRINAPWLVRIFPLLLILGACATGTIREKVLTLPVIEGAAYVGQDTCVGCHEDMASAFGRSIHGRLADFEVMGAEKGCESCHGPGSRHVESGDYGRILKFSELTADEAAAVCVKCHSDGKLYEWTHGEHALADVGCGECHRIHGEGAALRASLREEDPGLCYGCHREQQAKASFPSHHPVKEGKMTCGSCHNPHGELNTEENLNDLCYDCHSRFQGPFVFEHAPVQEDCSICHDPHGTVANNLLLQNEPFLCLQCHENHFHATREGSTLPNPEVANPGLAFDGNKLDELSPNEVADLVNSSLRPGETLDTGIPFTNRFGEDGWRIAFGTKCTVCHSVVHGSDLPSQSAPTQSTDGGQGWPDGGKGLTR